MSTLKQYFIGLRQKSVAAIGMGVSNAPLVTMLCQNGVAVTVRDRARRCDVMERAQQFEELGATLILGEGYLDDLHEDVIFRTPGLSPNVPQLASARERGSVITSEMALFFAFCPCHTIGITGSDGKTTTTSIIGEMLKAAGKTVWVGGNIGAPLLPQLEQMGEEDFAVVELSSFQLMDMERSPQTAVFTNLSPNHLDYHHTMEEYQSAKTNIFAHQKVEDRAIFNFDNEITRQLAEVSPAQVILFGRQQEIRSGVYLRANAIWMGEEEILPLDDILLPGTHNVENYMAAIAAVHDIVPVNVMRQVAATFGGVAHRMQLVRVLDGVHYYNDSIGSSPTRTIACLRALNRPTVLIAGGYDKEVPFDELAEEIVHRVHTLVLTGDTAAKISSALDQKKPHNVRVVMEKDFTDAVVCASQMAQCGDCVVLSPACASFDQFKDFVARGNRFCEIVQKLGD